MKKILSSLSILLVLSVSLSGQDSRQRTVETVVSDVLAAMPSQNAESFNTQMADLAAAAPQSVVLVASKLKPSARGVKNNLLEYALTGLSSYIKTNPSSIAKVSEGFVQAIDNAGDTEVKAFLMERFRCFATKEYSDIFTKNAKDPVLGSIAIGALTDIPGTEDIILSLMENEGADRNLLSAAASEKGISAAEPYIAKWALEAEGYDAEALCRALSSVGSEKSLPVLAGKSLPEYASLAVKLANGNNSKAVKKAAKALMGQEDSFLKSAGAEALMKNNPATVYKTLASALKSEDGQFRDAVLDDATEILGTGNLVPMLVGKFNKLSEPSKVDVLNWFGNYKISAAAGLVADAFACDGALADAAIAAAGKIGGDKLGKALIGVLAGEDAAKAASALGALKSFKGDIASDVVAALGTATDKEGLLNLASTRKLTPAAPAMFAMLENGDASVVKYLPGVVGTGDISSLGTLLSNAKENVGYLQDALYSAIHTLDPQEQYSTVKGLAEEAAIPENFYNVLSRTGTDAAAEDLAEILKTATGNRKAEAMKGLLSIDNYKAAEGLLQVAKDDPAVKDAALNRFIDLTTAYAPDADKKRLDIASVLKIADTKDVKAKALGALANIPTMKSFLLAGKYLDDKDVAYTAASAVKNIASKTGEEINYADFKASLEKAAEIFMSTGNADDGYAVNEIGKLLESAEPSPVSTLTAEEKKQGFEMLFDGTNLDKWQGDKAGYVPVNGTIYVTADYGSTGNLYTLKEYRNFVYRFEFCFLRPGVNNGVGVRTPMGVDAAYEGMCEVQILDHDADVYSGWLREYQVHGSVYGVVPAKRIVHKPLGEWSTEEIRVEGDRIKVTVNGEVIVDANIRTACKGHNVAPDGGSENPYTVDHRNHPGMFNKKGYISFCGHGEGLKIRNVRILDLGDKK